MSHNLSIYLTKDFNQVFHKLGNLTKTDFCVSELQTSSAILTDISDQNTFDTLGAIVYTVAV